MVMDLGLDLSKALIYVTHKMLINSWPFHGSFYSVFGFPCPLLSNAVICPFHQIYPHSVIKGHLGIISVHNLAFGGISCSCSLFIFLSENYWAQSNQKQTDGPAFPPVALLQNVYSPHVTLLLPESPFTMPHIKCINMHISIHKPAAPEPCLSQITFSSFKGRHT